MEFRPLTLCWRTGEAVDGLTKNSGTGFTYSLGAFLFPSIVRLVEWTSCCIGFEPLHTQEVQGVGLSHNSQEPQLYLLVEVVVSTVNIVLFELICLEVEVLPSDLCARRVGRFHRYNIGGEHHGLVVGAAPAIPH
jgi:hypothetical protein